MSGEIFDKNEYFFSPLKCEIQTLFKKKKKNGLVKKKKRAHFFNHGDIYLPSFRKGGKETKPPLNCN